jgi:hypothetical protein
MRVMNAGMEVFSSLNIFLCTGTWTICGKIPPPSRTPPTPQEWIYFRYTPNMQDIYVYLWVAATENRVTCVSVIATICQRVPLQNEATTRPAEVHTPSQTSV